MIVYEHHYFKRRFIKLRIVGIILSLVAELHLLAVDLEEALRGVEAPEYVLDFLEADLRLIVGVGSHIGLCVMVAAEHVEHGDHGGEGGLAELTRDEEIGQRGEAPVLIVAQAVEECGEEALHGCELERLAPFVATGTGLLGKADELPDMRR